jgi:hypothetical protein
MSAVSLTGQDVIVINGQIITTLADGDSAILTFPNDIAAAKIGKNGNAILAQNNEGYRGELKLRVLVGGLDDQMLNSQMQLQFQDFSSFTTLTGSITKRVSDGQGNAHNVVYPLATGVFKKQVHVKTNADGDTEQSVAEYEIIFAQVLVRTIQ